MANNQDASLPDTIAAAFAQDYPNLEILLSDDGSTDRTFAIMEEMAAAYQGPHRLRLYCNRPNLGLIGHINGVFTRAMGVLIVCNAGDDILAPARVSKLYAAFAEDRAMMSILTSRKCRPRGAL